MNEDLRTQFAKAIAGECKHRTGLNEDCCKAGINYLQLAGRRDGMALVLPCMRENLTYFQRRRQELGLEIVKCEKREVLTYEEALQQADRMFKAQQDMLKARAAAKAHAEARGWKRGNGGSAVIVCPVCGGSLRYRVASLNGHMHGVCSTPDCVRWME